MKDHLINPAKADEIVQEVFNNNSDIVTEFSNHFAKKILDFAELFSVAYKKYLELWRVCTDNNIQKAYVSGLSLLLLDNLLTSVKLFVLGYQTPSGNLMRQALEGIALSTLCVLNEHVEVKIKKNRMKEIHFFSCFIENEGVAKSHKALGLLEHNCERLGLQKEAITTLKKSRSHFHKHSHPSKESLATMMSFENPGKSFVGGSFDKGKVNIYKIELQERNNFCRILPNIFGWLIDKVNELPGVAAETT